MKRHNVKNRLAFLIFAANLLFLSYFIFYFSWRDLAVLSIVINLSVYLLPGIGWMYIFIRRARNTISFIFCALSVSIVIAISGIVVSYLFKIVISPLRLYGYIIVITNIGFLVSLYKMRKEESMDFKLGWTKTVALTMCILVGAYFALFLFGMYVVAPLEDSTLTAQSTAYGLLNFLKPYTLHDAGPIPYNFAHPFLLHIYNSLSILFTGHLDDLRYYYDYAMMAKSIIEADPKIGERLHFSIADGGEFDTEIIKIDDGVVTLDKAIPKIVPNRDMSSVKNAISENLAAPDFIIVDNNSLTDKIDYELYKKAVLWRLTRLEYGQFYKNPNIIPTRTPNILFTLLAVVVIFYIVKHLTYSNILAAFGSLIYITIPEILIRSTGGSHSALTNLAMLFVAYFYIVGKKTGERNYNSLIFYASIFAALSDHKTVIVFVAIFLNEIWLTYRNKEYMLSKRDSLCSRALFGFFIGLFIYWAYGMAVNAQFFIFDHLRNHLIERILHKDTLGYAGTHLTLSNLWASFLKNTGWGYLVLAIFVYLYSFKKRPGDYTTSFLAFWFIFGAFSFSIIDWHHTKHLLLVVPPIILGVVGLVNSQKGLWKTILVAVLLYTMAYNVKIIVDFINTRNLLLISPIW